MKAVMFVCHGNICRSPTAEFVMKDILKRKGKDGIVTVASSATSAEELGNSVYPPARRVLEKHGINCGGKRAVRLKRTITQNTTFLFAWTDAMPQMRFAYSGLTRTAKSYC